jgi:hypothetical protein
MVDVAMGAAVADDDAISTVVPPSSTKDKGAYIGVSVAFEEACVRGKLSPPLCHRCLHHHRTLPPLPPPPPRCRCHTATAAAKLPPPPRRRQAATSKLLPPPLSRCRCRPAAIATAVALPLQPNCCCRRHHRAELAPQRFRRCSRRQATASC